MTEISGKELVVNELGYWPEFADAKIIELVYISQPDATNNLSILLHYIDMEINRDLKVKVVLHGISDMFFNEFLSENVIDRLTISKVDSSNNIFEIEACVGLHGSCKCKFVTVELISSMPYA